jgi:CheY-like chemotaxis protein
VADPSKEISVLVVDDSEEFLTAVCAWIESDGNLQLIGTARNGAEALDELGRSTPDLVLMDAFMPVLDGFEATRRIKAEADAPLVVMLSVHEGSTVENEAWAAGADGYVSKAEFAKLLPGLISALLAGDTDRSDGRPGGRPRPRVDDTSTPGVDTQPPTNPDGPVEQRTTERPGRLHVLFRGIKARFINVGSARRPGVVLATSLTEGGER